MITKVKFSNNKYYPILIGDNQLPKYLPLKFMILNLKGKSYRTIYDSIKSYDLFDKFIIQSQTSNLSSLIYNDSFDIICLNLPYYSSWLSSKFKSQANINSFLSSMKSFLIWASSIYSSKHRENNLRICQMIDSQTYYKIKKRRVNKPISTEDINSILNLLNSNDETNPFLKKNRERNLLILFLLYETGIRKSELLGLKINDFIRDGNQVYIVIIERENDLEDTRKIRPSLKNNHSQRHVGISPDTYLLYEEYIKFYRKKKKRNSYLFTSELGSPLSMSMVSKIFEKVNKSTGIQCTPHMFRHFFSERMLSFLIEEKKLDMERAKDELRTLCGWSINSSMPNLYAQKYIQLIANKHNIERLQSEKGTYNSQ